MDRYTINSTYGEHSPGTEVEILEEGSSPDLGEFYTVCVINGPLDGAFDIPQSLITKRRNRTDMIPNPTRRERRIGQPRKEIKTGGSAQVLPEST